MVRNWVLENRKILYLPPQKYTVVVVQPVRTSDCGSEGRGFESHHPPKKALKFSGLFYFYFMELTAIILAGGKSTRMGTDKALIKIGDKSLLEIAIDICKPVCTSIIISSNNPEHGKFGYPVVADEIKDCGSIGGIYSCLKKSETGWNFIISVDTPFVTSDFILFLTTQTENYDVIVPFHFQGKEPLIALYNKNCLSVIEKQMSLHQFKIHHLITLMNTKYSDAREWVAKTPLLFKNLNRPEDFDLKK